MKNSVLIVIGVVACLWVSAFAHPFPPFVTMQWGITGDLPVAGDYDSDGQADIAVYRPSDGTWHMLFSSRAFALHMPGHVQWGMAGDIPVVQDFDGDGITDLTVYRPSTGTWYIWHSKGQPWHTHP